jgi:hypothetical protein
MTFTLCSSAARTVETDSASSVPPYIKPPMAQVPTATRETFSDAPGMSASSMLFSSVSALRTIISFLVSSCVG